MIAPLLAALSRPLPPPSSAPWGKHQRAARIDRDVALRCRVAALLALAIDGDGPRERAIVAAARESFAALLTEHAFVESEAEAARVVDRVLRERLFALPVGDRVPACVATVRALLDDTHDSMEALDRATRDCAAWRDVAVTVHHEVYADALVELAREMLR